MNQHTEANDGKLSQIKSGSRRWVAALALFLFGACGIWLLMPNRGLSPSVAILPANYSINAPLTPIPDRWIPRTWGWLWKIRYALLGKPVTVDIDTQMIRFREGRPLPIYKVFHEYPPLAFTNGVLAWILPEEELRLFCGRLELADDDEWRNFRPMFQPLIDFGDDRMPNYERRIFRMTLGQGVLATISGATTTQIKGTSLTAGTTINYAVHRHSDSLELTGVFTFSEITTNAHFHAPDPAEIGSLRTNLALAATMRIPRGHGVFLCDTNEADTRRRNFGIVIRPKAK